MPFTGEETGTDDGACAVVVLDDFVEEEDVDAGTAGLDPYSLGYFGS